MKTKTRQNKPLTVKSTKENNAGLSLLQHHETKPIYAIKDYNEFLITHLLNSLK